MTMATSLRQNLATLAGRGRKGGRSAKDGMSGGRLSSVCIRRFVRSIAHRKSPTSINNRTDGLKPRSIEWLNAPNELKGRPKARAVNEMHGTHTRDLFSQKTVSENSTFSIFHPLPPNFSPLPHRVAFFQSCIFSTTAFSASPNHHHRIKNR